MTDSGLGYVGIRSEKLEDWDGYATRFLGMQLVDKSSTTLSLRMDDRKQRVIVNAGADGAGFYGWEVADRGGARFAGRPPRTRGCRGGARKPRTG